MFLELQNVSVTYKGSAHPAVHDVTLGMRAGDIGVLVGPSGCGKTTLLRAVAGLEPVRCGQVFLAGRVVSKPGFALATERRRVGMVCQGYALFPHMQVADNIAYGLQSLPSSIRKERITEVLDLIGLSQYAGHFPHQLSGGQQQRVALARALAPRPDLLLLDEPFSNLDVELRERLAHEVRAILKAAQITALLVTHDQLEAFAIADTIGVMRGGVLHQWEDAYSVYHRPASRFVANFIGHGVFAPATLVQTETQVVVETPLGRLVDISECPLPSVYPNGVCDVLLRPDDIVHDEDSPVRAAITRKAFRGSEFLYTLRLEDGLEILALVPSHHNYQIGERMGIRAEADHVVTFVREAVHAG